MFDISITWKDKNKWVPFELSDIAHMSRSHAIALFSHSIPVIAKQGTTYIVNNNKLLEQYQKRKVPVKLFSELAPDERKLSIMGFI